MSHDIELKLHSVADAHESVKRGGSFHFEVAAVDAEFSLRAQIICRYGYLCRNRYRPRHSVQRQISSDLQVGLIVRVKTPARNSLARGFRKLQPKI